MRILSNLVLVLSVTPFACGGGGTSDAGGGGEGSTSGEALGSGGSGNSSGGNSNGTTGGSSAASGGAGTGGAGEGAKCDPTCGSSKWACYPMPTAGIDGGAHPNPAYEEREDGTVYDPLTCLSWEKEMSSEKFTWDAAQAHCASLGPGFRLPTRIELTSILDFSVSPAVTSPFASSPTNDYYFTNSGWIVSNVEGKPKYTWIFGLNNGFTSNAGPRDDENYARCVHSEVVGEGPTEAAVAPANHYTIGNGVVTDNYTGLTWERGHSPEKIAFSETQAYCDGLAVGGFDDFRVPTLHELSTLVDEARVAPSIDPEAFPDTPWKNGGTVLSVEPPEVEEDKDWFFSATTVRGNASLGFGLNFMDGFTGPQGVDPVNDSGKIPWNYWTLGWVKCVR